MEQSDKDGRYLGCAVGVQTIISKPVHVPLDNKGLG